MKMNDNIVVYLNKTFGTNFSLYILKVPYDLPIYLQNNRSFYLLSDNTEEFVLVETNDDERFGVVAYEKQMIQFFDYYKKPVAFYFDKLSKAQRDSLISRKIAFISSEQLYLPYLGMNFKRRFINSTSINYEKMMPITQSLYLYLALILKGDRTNKKDAANYLNVTQTSLTRASLQLLKMDLIEQKINGKEYYISIKDSRYDSFLKAKKYLINPIQESYYVETNDSIDAFPMSGESALSRYSMLNEPKYKCVSMFKDKKIDSLVIEEQWNIERNITKIELWKYDPILFAYNGVVDPISLYMSFQGNEDERIEGELERMIEEYKW